MAWHGKGGGWLPASGDLVRARELALDPSENSGHAVRGRICREELARRRFSDPGDDLDPTPWWRSPQDPPVTSESHDEGTRCNMSNCRLGRHHDATGYDDRALIIWEWARGDAERILAWTCPVASPSPRRSFKR
jgi:hypothetical protein